MLMDMLQLTSGTGGFLTIQYISTFMIDLNIWLRTKTSSRKRKSLIVSQIRLLIAK